MSPLSGAGRGGNEVEAIEVLVAAVDDVHLEEVGVGRGDSLAGLSAVLRLRQCCRSGLGP